MKIIDNTDIAILTKLNELIERHGLKPYDCTAEVRGHADTGLTELRFVTVSADPALAMRAEAVADSIAGPQGIGDGRLIGDDKTIIDALDQALAKAPRRPPASRSFPPSRN